MLHCGIQGHRRLGSRPDSSLGPIWLLFPPTERAGSPTGGPVTRRRAVAGRGEHQGSGSDPMRPQAAAADTLRCMAVRARLRQAGGIAGGQIDHQCHRRDRLEGQLSDARAPRTSSRPAERPAPGGTSSRPCTRFELSAVVRDQPREAASAPCAAPRSARSRDLPSPRPRICRLRRPAPRIEDRHACGADSAPPRRDRGRAIGRDQLRTHHVAGRRTMKRAPSTRGSSPCGSRRSAVLDPDAAAMRLDDLLGDRKPEAGILPEALVRAVGVEALEDLVERVRAGCPVRRHRPRSRSRSCSRRQVTRTVPPGGENERALSIRLLDRPGRAGSRDPAP